MIEFEIRDNHQPIRKEKRELFDFSYHLFSLLFVIGIGKVGISCI